VGGISENDTTTRVPRSRVRKNTSQVKVAAATVRHTAAKELIGDVNLNRWALERSSSTTIQLRLSKLYKQNF
jgi:hypothetical protein